jgi:hypothetical protein
MERQANLRDNAKPNRTTPWQDRHCSDHREELELGSKDQQNSPEIDCSPR